MKVDTTNYRETHGTAPKGTAMWSFSICRNGAWTTFTPGVEMKLADAKKLAISEAKLLGADFVQVDDE